MSLRPGKLPAAMLAELLGTITHRDPRVLVGPGIGRDAAVIDLGGGRCLVAKTDPVTFATEQIGWYAVHVNANDIACMGARPAWFLATALLPPGAPNQLPATIFDQITAACDELQIELVGGHTEVTIGLDRPIVVGAMLGEAARDEIVCGENIRAGDHVLMTRGIAIEGTALLAREAAYELAARGASPETIERGQAMLFDPGISIVADARALCAAARPRLMHDPTEGGLATALQELASAAGATLRMDASAIRICDETRAICAALGLDPLGLLASGTLLAVVSEADAGLLGATLTDPDRPWRSIGRIESGQVRVIMGTEDPVIPFPVFARDELARFFDSADRGRDTSNAGSREGS
jgi:hydrogenase expression/formation protein HypE